ncbi:MAG TPA: hypothetical protein VNG12_24730 [Acidimicrobiales bacterium]|nr:hypothetical protein [Acidimicrobiales bacterium]
MNNWYAIRSDGTLWRWGPEVHLQQFGSAHWRSINTAAGGGFTIGIQTDGSLWAWGNNNFGQIGTGTYGGQMSNPQRIGTDTDWKLASPGDVFVLAIKNDGSLWAWGNNEYGELGNGSFQGNQGSPERIGSDFWKQVSAGIGYSTGIQTNGTLWTWGGNADGNLGDGSTNQSNSPEQIGRDADWSQVSAGDHATAGIKSDGTLWTWGTNTDGDLGNGSVTDSYVPAEIGPSQEWTQVVSGTLDMAAIGSSTATVGPNQNLSDPKSAAKNQSSQSCPTSAELLAAWSVSRGIDSGAAGSVAGFKTIACWKNWVVASVVGRSTGEFYFSRSGGLHALSAVELSQFNAALCSDPSAPSGWKGPSVVVCSQ